MTRRELIYRWASRPECNIPERDRDNQFIKQMKRIAKEVGWLAS